MSLGLEGCPITGQPSRTPTRSSWRVSGSDLTYRAAGNFALNCSGHQRPRSSAVEWRAALASSGGFRSSPLLKNRLAGWAGLRSTGRCYTMAFLFFTKVVYRMACRVSSVGHFCVTDSRVIC